MEHKYVVRISILREIPGEEDYEISSDEWYGLDLDIASQFVEDVNALIEAGELLANVRSL